MIYLSVTVISDSISTLYASLLGNALLLYPFSLITGNYNLYYHYYFVMPGNCFVYRRVHVECPITEYLNRKPKLILRGRKFVVCNPILVLD